MLTRRPGILHVGGHRFGLWALRHGRRTGLSRGPRFAEVYLRGAGVGVHW
jgi:hypothetical protein